MKSERVPVNSEAQKERSSLAGKTVVITRRAEQAKEFSDVLMHYGAKVLHFPAVEIVEPTSWNECDAALEQVSGYSGIVFTSRNAVQYFLRRVTVLKKEQDIRKCLLYVVGEKTKHAIEEFGFQSEELPGQFSAEALARMLTAGSITGKKYLFPKGNLARNEIVDILTEHGAQVDDVLVYQTLEPLLDEERKRMIAEIKERADLVTFFSPSSVVQFLRSYDRSNLQKKHIAVFGTTTAAAAQHEGLTVDIVSPQSTLEAFVGAIRRFYSHTESEYAITQ